MRTSQRSLSLAGSGASHRVRAGAGAWIVAAAVAAIVPQATGQTIAGHDWHQGTTLAGFVGSSSSQSVTDAAAGFTVGWELTPHFAVEGRGLWLDAGPGADAFTALLGARLPILPGRRIVPFVSGGAGVYRATSDQGSFDDFDLAVGTGGDIALGGRFALRPEVTILFVTTQTETRTIPVFGVHLAYHFDSHPVTPARAPTRAAGTR